MSAKSRVLVTAPLPEDLLRPLQAAFDVHMMTTAAARDSRAVEDALAGAEGWVLSQTMAVGGELLDRCPQLRVISKVGVGYDNIDVPAATARRVLVCNTPDVLNGAVADLTFAILLSLTRRLRQNEAHLRSGAWLEGAGPFGHDIRGRTFGIIGLGAIGRTVAQTARGFDMHVIYYKRRRDTSAEAAGLAEYRPRDEVFREADVLSVHCPLTPETQRSIGAREFALMKPTAFFVNTSRGAVVDQDALIDALESKALAGAALDVMEPEPLDPRHRLCRLDNVVLTPHVGSGTYETRRAMHELSVENLIAGMAGRRPRAPVNPDVLG